MSDRDDMNFIECQINRLAMILERMHMGEYVEYLRRPKSMIFRSFLSGMARGFGMAIGFTVLGAVAIVILTNVAVDNLPLIGDFLADVIRIIQERL